MIFSVVFKGMIEEIVTITKYDGESPKKGKDMVFKTDTCISKKNVILQKRIVYAKNSDR